MSVSHFIKLAQEYKQIADEYEFLCTCVYFNEIKEQSYATLMIKYTTMAAECFQEDRYNLSHQFADRADRVRAKMRNIYMKVEEDSCTCYNLQDEAGKMRVVLSEIASGLPAAVKGILMKLVAPLKDLH